MPGPRSLSVTHLDVFARRAGGGNACPVVTDTAGLSTEDLQAVAAHFGQECGFVTRDPDGSVRLRFFVPRHEMAMCVHATVAAVTVLLEAGELPGGSAVVRTGSGDCRVSWDDGDPPSVTVEQQPPVLGPPLHVADALERALGLAPGSVDRSRAVRSADVSRAKLVVPLTRVEDVHAADPDLAALWDVCREAGTTGAYPFAPVPGSPGHVVARQFPVDAGYPEDAATGVAAGALAAYLADERRPRTSCRLRVDIDQGDAMGRPSRLQATADTDAGGVRRTTVTGRASVRSREVVDLPRLRRMFR